MVAEVEVRVGRNALPLLAHLDLRRAHAKMASYLSSEMGRMFETEGSSRGHPWVPLSPRYAHWKRAHGKTPRILVLSGRLRASATPIGISQSGFRFRFRDPKAKFHDSDDARKSNLPQRKLLRVIPRDLDEFENILRDEFEAAAARGNAGGSAP